METTCGIISKTGRCIFTICNKLTIYIVKIGITATTIIGNAVCIEISRTTDFNTGILKTINSILTIIR
jgi:hypothetical protein